MREGKMVFTALHNVRVFHHDHFSEPTTVFIADGIIVNGAVDVTDTIQCDGRYLIPGLIDSHLHVSDISDLEDLSSYGVTTAFNMNCLNYTACAILADQPGLTKILSAGLAAVGLGSHHQQLSGLPADETINCTSEATDVVSRVFGNGSQYMKIVSELNGPTLDVQRAVVGQTHARGHQAMTHATEMYWYELAVSSGSDGLQHIPADRPLTTDVVIQLRKQSQFVTPTLNIFKLLDSEPGFVPFLLGSNTTNGSYATAKQNARVLHRAGVPMLAGTDAIGNIGDGSITDPFGLTLHWELQHFVDAGMTPAEAIQSATSSPAFMHRQFDRGLIEAGKRADLVLLNKNPLKNITNTLDIARVWIGGIEYRNISNLS
ncbi:hypothetical protein M409DRAFT_65548 [Zasmidium cellare ATCC 36951]|uniref:Amidohydrolase-related domain-containing protein n=1 Tax=Zasmidium cellare ATCC 36951 TaxID=1080233 RepID=A0A6A6CPT2_ZASCE|nr:uncharacterized protein M409DRAFT_65548 [Zasmidium cellare ATCC 36951]KAF2168683.1 hypothetical protein M409DRAFT_65548 [Zasmidium cellare ATCC 36951]